MPSMSVKPYSRAARQQRAPSRVLFDNSPLPSGTDRRTLLAYYLRPLVALKSAFGGGRVRFYLGENGFVREFHTPDVMTLLSADRSSSVTTR